jgi:hypothetical protein
MPLDACVSVQGRRGRLAGDSDERGRPRLVSAGGGQTWIPAGELEHSFILFSYA